MYAYEYVNAYVCELSRRNVDRINYIDHGTTMLTICICGSSGPQNAEGLRRVDAVSGPAAELRIGFPVLNPLLPSTVMGAHDCREER